MTLAPGETGWVRLHVKAFTGRQAAELAGQEWSLVLAPQVSELARQVQWSLRCRYRQGWVARPAVVELGEELVRGSKPLWRHVSMTAAADVQEVGVTGGTRRVTGRLRPGGDRRSYELEVLVRPEPPVGFFDEMLRVWGRTRAGEKLWGGVRVRGRVMEAIGAQPEMITWGMVEVGRQMYEQVVLFSRTGEKFQIEKVETAEVPGLHVEYKTKERMESKQILNITCRILRVGKQEQTIWLNIRTAREQFRLPLWLTYEGIDVRKEREP